MPGPFILADKKLLVLLTAAGICAYNVQNRIQEGILGWAPLGKGQRIAMNAGEVLAYAAGGSGLLV